METIESVKQRDATETPLFLFECCMSSGQVERWSTHGVDVGGHSYHARVVGQSAFEMKLSSDGADAASRMSLTLANADAYFSELERQVGFKGAQLTVRFVFFGMGTGEPATETRTVFRGVAGSPDEITETTLRVTFTNRLNLHRSALPQVRIQRRCPWTFPSSGAERLEAVDGGANGEYSRFYRCGYSPDAPGGCGNPDQGGRPFTSCGYTKADCVQRGMFDRDSLGRDTRRFGGIQFVPPTVAVRSYGEGASRPSAVQTNEAKYNDVVPLVYGTAWYAPPVVCARSDGNLTRMEALLGLGEIERVLKVLVNDVEIPEGVAGANMTATGWYSVVTHGSRTGAFNPDFADGSGVPIGDPYGSMAMIAVVVPNRLNDGQRLPRIQVLAEGRRLPRFDSTGAGLEPAFTNNPAWVTLDVLRRSGWQAADLDLAAFAKTAAHFDEPLSTTDLNGNPTSIPRAQCNLALVKPRSAADLIRGIRTASPSLLGYSSDGLLAMRPEGTVALQHGGRPAYEFSDGTASSSGILRRDNGRAHFRLCSRSASESTNRLTVEFQDEFNEYQQDSLALVDLDDAALSMTENTGSLAALGLPNFNQAARALTLALRKAVDGNLFVDFATSVRAFGLAPGDIIAITYAREGFDHAPFRILRIAPEMNYRTAVITAQLHSDDWYANESQDGGTRGRGQRAGNRIPRPIAGAELDDEGRQRFAIVEKMRLDADGSSAVELTASFRPPAVPGANGPATPLLSMTPEVRSSGGSLADGIYYYAVSAVDDSGLEGPLSFCVRAIVNASTSAVTLRDLSFGERTAAFHVYRGSSPAVLVRLASRVPVGAAFTDDGSITSELASPPDANYDHANFYWRVELVPETAATGHAPNRIDAAGMSLIPNEYRGSVVRITRGRGAGQERIVAGNDDTTVTVAPLWDIEPDDTSQFTICESSWRFGALSSTDRAQFDVPNRSGATIQIIGRSANVYDEECAAELSPVTRWRIGSGGAGDSDVPPEPRFAVYAGGDGNVRLTGIGFEDLANTRTIRAGTWTLWYDDELAPATGAELSAPLTDGDADVDIPAPAGVGAGDVLRIDNELVTVVAVAKDGAQCTVARGAHKTIVASHAVGTVAALLTRRIEIVPFTADFFGSPASGDYAHSTRLPDAKVRAAELFLNNAIGTGPTARISFLHLQGGALRTLSGSQYALQVDGFVAVQAHAVPPVVIAATHAVRDVFAVVGSAPVGGPIELRLSIDGETYRDLRIESGAIASDTLDGSTLPPLCAGSRLELAVVSVPVGVGTFPGRDLTMCVRM